MAQAAGQQSTQKQSRFKKFQTNTLSFTFNYGLGFKWISDYSDLRKNYTLLQVIGMQLDDLAVNKQGSAQKERVTKREYKKIKKFKDQIPVDVEKFKPRKSHIPREFTKVGDILQAYGAKKVAGIKTNTPDNLIKKISKFLITLEHANPKSVEKVANMEIGELVTLAGKNTKHLSKALGIKYAKSIAPRAMLTGLTGFVNVSAAIGAYKIAKMALSGGGSLQDNDEVYRKIITGKYISDKYF